MAGRSAVFAAASAFALGAQAFLIPGGVKPDENSDSDLVVSLVNVNERIVQVACASCVAPARRVDETAKGEGDEEDALFWAQGGANNIVVNFTVTTDKKALLMNDREVWPRLSGDDFHGWYVQQVPAAAPSADVRKEEVPSTNVQITGAGFTILDQMQVAKTQDETVVLGVKFFSLDGRPAVVDDLEVMLYKLEDGQLLIVTVTPVPQSTYRGPSMPPLPPPHHPPPPMGDDMSRGPPGPPPPSRFGRPDCGMLPGPLCRLKHQWEHKMGGNKHGRPGCAGRKGGRPHRVPGHIKAPPFPVGGLDASEQPHHRHGRPDHMGSHGGWEPAHHEHGLLHVVLRRILVVLIPVVAGMAVGVMVSAVGMLVGRFTSWAWIKFARGGRRGYASLQLQQQPEERVEHVTDNTSEAKGLLPSEMEAPPAYQDAPAYEAEGKE